MRPIGTVSIAALIALAACGGGNDKVTVADDTTAQVPSTEPDVTEAPADTEPTPTTVTSPTAGTPTTTTEVSNEADPEAFLSDLFLRTPDSGVSALAAATPGSPAEQYAFWQTTLTDINTDAGYPSEPAAVTADDSTVTVCHSSNDCSTYTDFTGADGTITTFLVDGKEIEPRLGGRSEPTTIGPVSVTVLSSYRTVSGDDLGVLIEVTATSAVEVHMHTAAYVGVDGRQVSAGPSGVGVLDIASGATVRTAATFPRSDPGGRLILQTFDGDTYDSYDFDVVVPTL